MDKNKLAEEYAKSLRPFIASYKTERISAFLAGFDAAESIANAKIQELEERNSELEDHTMPLESYQELQTKITELEQQLKDEKCFNDAGSKELNEACSRIKELEQQLKKAEEVIEQLNIFNDAWATQESPEVEILRNSSRIKMLKLLHKYNEQYLKSRWA